MEIDPLSAIMYNWGPLGVSHLPSCLALPSCRYRGRSRLYVARGSFRINWKVFLEPVLKAASKARLTMRRKEKPFLLGSVDEHVVQCLHASTCKQRLVCAAGRKTFFPTVTDNLIFVHCCWQEKCSRVGPHCRMWSGGVSQRVNLLSWIDIVSPASLQCNLALPVVLAQHHLSVLIVVSDVSTLQKPAQLSRWIQYHPAHPC